MPDTHGTAATTASTAADSAAAPAHRPLPDLGRVGLWTSALDFLPIDQLRDTAAELDALGYGALWWGETVGRETFTQALLLLESSPRIPVATGIANLWARDAVATNGAARTLLDAHPGRFLLGLGVSHGPLVEGLRPGGNVYDKPLSLMRRYLDGLDASLYFASGAELPRPPRVLAALGPRMLELARDRAEGAHTYLVTPEHTARAREVLGAGGYLAVEQGAVFTTDRETALRRAREHLKPYLGLPNYRNNWLRLGLTEDDLADGGSDRLVDMLVVSGDEDTIRARVEAHHAAGADHVCVQVLGESMVDLTMADWRDLAPALLE